MPPGAESLRTSAGPAAADGGTRLALLGAVAGAWLLVVFGPTGMGAGTVAFVAAWAVMMAAMMLPSAAPLVLLHRRGASPGGTALLTAGYLTVWAATGVPAYLAMELLPAAAGPIALAAAGLYQLTPLKHACLVRCRTPADFLVQRWGKGAFRLGLGHGTWCLGCCWALMAVLVVTGAMGLAWVVGVAGVVAAEKLTRHGRAWSRVTGVALLVGAAVAFAQGTGGEGRPMDGMSEEMPMDVRPQGMP